MEHRKKGRRLGRTASHKRALLSNLSVSLIKNKRIRTTEAKAKELRTYFEPLVTKAKDAFRLKDSAPERNVHLRRIAKKSIKDKEAIKILFDEIGPKVGDRPGGYTRVLKTGFRAGDGASLAIIELVDYSFIKEKEEPSSGKKKVKSKFDKKEEQKPVKEKVSEEVKADVTKKEIVEKEEEEKVKKIDKDVKTLKEKKVGEEKIKENELIAEKEIGKEEKKEVKKTKTASKKKDVKKEAVKSKTVKSKKSDTSSKDKK